MSIRNVPIKLGEFYLQQKTVQHNTSVHKATINAPVRMIDKFNK